MNAEDSHKPYNPLEKRRLAESIVVAFLETPKQDLPPQREFKGAGIYALYYSGSFELYKPVSAADCPIYVGKALPRGSRKGGVGLSALPGKVLYTRLKQHARSIEQAENIELTDFKSRFLVVDDIWITLAESLLIEKYVPVWNTIIEGYGIHDPGRGRAGQKRSVWDELHPGRTFAKVLPSSQVSLGDIRKQIEQVVKTMK